MSRVGKKPVAIPAGVAVTVNGRDVAVKGPKGELKLTVRPEVEVTVEDGHVQVKAVNETRQANAMHGLFRALIQNMVFGVDKGYEKKLEIFGTGYLFALQGKQLQVRVGFANEIHMEVPDGLVVKCADQQHVQINGCDKQLVTQFAAEVRAIKPAEPYLGKGIKYEGEVIRRKETKVAGKK